MEVYKISVALEDCNNCNSKESVKVVHKENSKTGSIKVYRCKNCNYQFGFKEIYKKFLNDSNGKRSEAE